MKNSIIIFAALLGTLATVPGQGQSNAIEKYFSDLEAREDATVLTLSGKAFDMAGELQTDENDGAELKMVKELASKVTGLTVVHCAEATDAKAMAAEASRKVRDAFEELLVVKNGETLVRVLIDDLDGKIREVLFVAGQDKIFVVASLTGDMNLNEVGRLTQTVTRASSKLTGDVGPTEQLMVYPNPAKKGEELRVRLTEDLAGAPVRIHDASGREVMVVKAQGREATVRTDRLVPGVYMVGAAANGAEMTGKFIIE